MKWRFSRWTRLWAVLLAVWVGAATAPAVAEGPPDRPRVAVLDWELAQTVIALGVEPVAVAGAAGYREWVVHPPLPASTIDVGRRAAPSLTALRGVRPDLIVMSDYYDRGREQLERIAPVLDLMMVQRGTEPIARGLEVARILARRLDRVDALETLRERLDTALARLRERVRAGGHGGERVHIIQFRDANHVRVYGSGSVFHGVIERAGLENAWDGDTNLWGFSLAEITRLDQPADHTIVIEPVLQRAEEVMRDSPVWRALPSVRGGRVQRLDPVWPAGGVPAAIRFARLLARTLDDAD